MSLQNCVQEFVLISNHLYQLNAWDLLNNLYVLHVSNIYTSYRLLLLPLSQQVAKLLNNTG